MSRSRLASSALVLSSLVAFARAQTPYPRMLFSFDTASPSLGRPAFPSLVPMGAADTLTPGNFTPPPIPGPGIPPFQPGFAALPPALGPEINHPAAQMGLANADLDALSAGNDAADNHGDLSPLRRVWWMSFDRNSLGLGTLPTPSLLTEAPGNDAAADVFIDLGLPQGPLNIPSAELLRLGHVAVIDGNGRRSTSSSYVYPATALLEPSPAFPTAPTDNLDALNMDAVNPAFEFFSLSSTTAPPPFVGGAILVNPISTPGGPFGYITANQLGLDLIGGPNSDDLDALALRENGLFGLQVVATSVVPEAPPWWEEFQSLPQALTPLFPPDVLFFSVRTGSAVIGAPDSRFGLPIEPGDILTPPLVAGQLPGIWVAAENLGLRTTRLLPGVPADDIDGLDISFYDTTPAGLGLPDCDGDGDFDAREIALGTEPDPDRDLKPTACDP
jgi:hypothetical protein